MHKVKEMHQTTKDSKSAVASWDTNAKHRAVELESEVDSAYRSLVSHIRHQLKLAGVQAGARILDVGCGVGAATNALARDGHSVVGIDPSGESIREAEIAQPGGRFHVASIEDAVDRDILGPKFDVVVANMVLHTVMDLPGFMRSVALCLKPGGALIATLPHPQHYLEQRADLVLDGYEYGKPRLFWINFRINGQPDHPARVPYFHRPIEDYRRELLRTFFELESEETPSQVGVGKPHDILILRSRFAPVPVVDSFDPSLQADMVAN